MPARAEFFGGFAPPLEDVERPPAERFGFISCPFGTVTALPGAGTRWRAPLVRLF